ncbi:MAG: hypothetical protein H6R18_657, partial [Proteobacteria bacterium]|nr:hypothetical protein [Pseudomonadota bacterium]
MFDRRVFLKTLRGLRETSGSANDLPENLRNVLKEIDGKMPLGEVCIKLGMPEAEFQNTIKRFINEKYITEAETPKVMIAPSSASSSGDDDGIDLDFTSLAADESAEDEKKEAEEKAKRDAEDKARKAAEEKARQEAETRAKKEAEEKARKEAEEK